MTALRIVALVLVFACALVIVGWAFLNG